MEASKSYGDIIGGRATTLWWTSKPHDDDDNDGDDDEDDNDDEDDDDVDADSSAR